MSGALTVTPSGGSAIAGTATLASDLVTFTFVPQTALAPGKVYTVSVSGESDMVGNAGVSFTSTFTTAASIAPINVSTGLNASGQLITVNNTNDAHWTYVQVANLPGRGTEPLYAILSGRKRNRTGGAAADYMGTGDTGFYGGWPVQRVQPSDWININPNSVRRQHAGRVLNNVQCPRSDCAFKPLPGGPGRH